MNRREFLKSAGIAVVAPASILAADPIGWASNPGEIMKELGCTGPEVDDLIKRCNEPAQMKSSVTIEHYDKGEFVPFPTLSVGKNGTWESSYFHCSTGRKPTTSVDVDWTIARMLQLGDTMSIDTFFDEIVFGRVIRITENYGVKEK